VDTFEGGRSKEVDYEGKRLALKMLGITIWLDSEDIAITGTLDPGIVLTPSGGRLPLLKGSPVSFSLISIY
jgi:hypothetical protein